MRILLVGEYSRLHNSLKEGLVSLQHEVSIVGDGDGFKNYNVDYSIEAKWSKKLILNILRQLIYKISGYDFAKLERGIRFYFLLPKFKGFDVVQLINETPIKTNPALELYLLKKLAQLNSKLFLLSSGVDYLNVSFWMKKKSQKSVLTPFFENETLKPKFEYIFNYLSETHRKNHDFVYQNCNGIIATDFDYVIPLKGNPKFLGLIPNPVNIKNLSCDKLTAGDKIVIFLGINRGNYNQKGICYFEDALETIKEKYPEKVEIITAENIPYDDYINLYNKSHILLDQVYALDQGYNALEAMAKGKVVFTGAGKDFTEYYQLNEKAVINAEPDVAYLVKELSYLIENPDEISAISKRARIFIEKEHDYIRIAEKYIAVWQNN
ncbi:glycosyltransferase family protein [Flavobacterium sp.]|uniref:glycosyltransferase family protein n=1 Tax=Flavobacterium sp. TaxID=239 RepID=UPI003D6C1625